MVKKDIGDSLEAKEIISESKNFSINNKTKKWFNKIKDQLEY